MPFAPNEARMWIKTLRVRRPRNGATAIFGYEVKPNMYEVTDGQQRASAIRAFYSNELALDGLESHD